MKKICILQNSMTYGGTDTFVINLCRGLVKDGYDVTVVLSADENETLPREGELLDTGVRILKTCHLHGGASKLKHLKLLYAELKRGKYDAFQSNIDLFNGPQMLVAWLAGVPVRECHSHNSQQGRELSQGRTVPIRFYQGVMRWLCWTFSNRRCGCSNEALDFLFLDRWRKDNDAKVIHNGIDLGLYQKNRNRDKIKGMLGLNNLYTICTVGRIAFQKNPEFLLDVFYELTKMRDDVDLVWCGKGEAECSIKQKIKMLKLEMRVKMLGQRNDIAEILGASDIFLLPSRFEGLGIVLIEAQAAGLPCVISDVVPDAVNCGLCLPLSLEKSAEHWALQINKILDGIVSFTLAKEKLEGYGIYTMVKEMEEVLK